MLEDMSISRKHAKLHIKQGTVQLEDDNSKFGTFVVLQGCMQNCKEATLMSSKWTFNLSVVE
jgi:pSer/pThr/pTyr-binding forkhead associated (FHA) protein